MAPRRLPVTFIAALTLLVANVTAARAQSPPNTYQIINRYPHDSGAFTQGLFFQNDALFESTGLNGSSSLREVDLVTGAVLRSVDVPPEYFAEGMTIFQGKIFQLTWQSHVGFIYDPATFAKIGEFSYSGEGWGLTHDGASLIMSDGTNQIRFLDPSDFHVIRTISVVNSQGDPLTNINELEYINGEIYANVWQTDIIVRIDPTSGAFRGWIDFTGLLPPGTSADVLNGIAYDSATRHFLITGKFWPYLFEIDITTEKKRTGQVISQ